MSLILNVLWVIFGGGLSAFFWLLMAVLFALSIVGLPFTRACLSIAVFTFWPFGRIAVNRRELTGQVDIGTSELGMIGNILWFVIAGFWLALWHLFCALLCAVTIIGLPFAWAHLKLVGIAVAPIGVAIVDADDADAIFRRR